MNVIVDGRGRVLRVTEGDYTLLPHVTIGIDRQGNEKLLAALRDSPESFMWDGTTFRHRVSGTEHVPSVGCSQKRRSFEVRDAADLKARAQAAKSMPELRALVAELADVLAELQAIVANSL